MIRRPPRSTLFPYTNALPIYCSGQSPRTARVAADRQRANMPASPDRKSTRLNSSHLGISYAVFCLKKKNNECKPAVKGAGTLAQLADDLETDVSAAGGRATDG